MPKQSYDIFISYRRKETADKAEHLFTLLEHCGYRGQVSFDRENFDGRFDLEILKRLDNCTDFIVVLAQDTLSELNEEETDWYHRLAICSINEFSSIENEMKAAGYNLDFVRLEIARAIAKDKHIIPVVPINTPNYCFDDLKLPNDICLLIKQHAEKYQDSKDFLFKDILPRITKRLKSRPYRHTWLKTAITIVLSLILIGCIGGWVKWNNEKNAFQSCRTRFDFEEFAQNSYFFRSESLDSLLCFETLTRNNVPINDALNTGRKDSIRVNWSDDCSLKQLRILRKMINNMMFVEKGTFIMGSKNPIGLENFETPVTVENDYYIGKFEVTELEWNIIMTDSVIGNDHLPVADVSWKDCMQFVRKLQMLTTGLLFTLPTEIQWEYAAKKNGSADWIYAGGNTPKDVANYKGSSNNGCVEDVGSRDPNGLDLYDMSGNVSEWCFDGNDNRKRIRGGSFMSSCVGISVSYSDVASVDNRSETIGFRLVLNE